MNDRLASVLAQCGQALNSANIVWGVGASALLYQYGLTSTVTDIDLIVTDTDFSKAEEIISLLGTKQLIEESDIYRTEHFHKYCIQDTEVDLISGFKIVVPRGGEYSYPFDTHSIPHYFKIKNVSIPFATLEDWYILYQLMPDREAKVKKIEEYFHQNTPKYPFLLERLLDTKNIPLKVKERSQTLLSIV